MSEQRARITIDGRSVEVPAGGSILDGARALGIEIPTLCHLERCGPMTSCLACVVKVQMNGRSSVVPSCGMKAVDGMVVESETAEVHELRRSALELLLSDHVGDCLSPCARICPLGMNIPEMLRRAQRGQTREAAAVVRAALALPAVLGRLCHKPCENGCRRASCDSAAAIRDVERFVADADLTASQPELPSRAAPSGKRVAIVGAGPTGLAAAHELSRAGHDCVVFDRHDAAGGTLWLEVSRGALEHETLDREVAVLERMGIQFRCGEELGRTVGLAGLRAEYDAVLLAVGAVEAADAERLGVVAQGPGVKLAQPDAYLTTVPGVFCAGSAARPIRQLVRAMSEGQAAGKAIGEFLAGREPRKPGRPFSSVMGRLESSELALFLEGASPAPRVVARNGCAYDAGEAAAESARCLHCDCRAAGNCRLQRYAQMYGAEFGRFTRQRRAFAQARHPARVLFEPGKCILCGICVKIASDAAEPLGLTFVGRGFDVRVAAPLNEEFEAGLTRVAAECAEACPTGAIELEG
jgi:ferredoxin